MPVVSAHFRSLLISTVGAFNAKETSVNNLHCIFRLFFYSCIAYINVRHNTPTTKNQFVEKKNRPKHSIFY